MSFAEPASPSPSGAPSTAASSPPRRPTRRPEDLRSGLTLGAPPGSLSKMTLEDWLKQDRGLADQLKVIEGLCSALNGAHQRREVHRALHPGNIEVASDGTCDLSEAVSGPLSPRYRAPEVVEGGPPSAESDIYAAGVIFYEMLSGRSPSGERPTPLSDLRQDVSRDLTDAIMGCLERGPDWRPKDLSYLLQVVASMRNAGAKSGGRAAGRAPAQACGGISIRATTVESPRPPRPRGRRTPSPLRSPRPRRPHARRWWRRPGRRRGPESPRPPRRWRRLRRRPCLSPEPL